MSLLLLRPPGSTNAGDMATDGGALNLENCVAPPGVKTGSRS